MAPSMDALIAARAVAGMGGGGSVTSPVGPLSRLHIQFSFTLLAS